MSTSAVSSPRVSRRRAFTLVEAVISILIVAIMYTAVLNTVGAARVGQQRTGDSQQGQLLAQQLMEEILLHDYADTDSPTFGTETGEAGRADFDDLDDYAGWVASPPQHEDGSVMSDLARFERRVEVAWVEPSDFENTAAFDTGLKRITVTVRRDGHLLALLSVVRTSSRWDPLESLEIEQ